MKIDGKVENSIYIYLIQKQVSLNYREMTNENSKLKKTNIVNNNSNNAELYNLKIDFGGEGTLFYLIIPLFHPGIRTEVVVTKFEECANMVILALCIHHTVTTMIVNVVLEAVSCLVCLNKTCIKWS